MRSNTQKQGYCYVFDGCERMTEVVYSSSPITLQTQTTIPTTLQTQTAIPTTMKQTNLYIPI